MTIFREDHEQPWQLHHLCLSVRSMFDALRKYAIEVEEQNDQDLNSDTIIGMCEAGYDLADRAWKQSMEVDLNREHDEPVKLDAGDDVLDPPSEEGIRIGQHFDALDAEQQDTIRRVLRQFPI